RRLNGSVLRPQSEFRVYRAGGPAVQARAGGVSLRVGHGGGAFQRPSLLEPVLAGGGARQGLLVTTQALPWISVCEQSNAAVVESHVHITLELGLAIDA